MWRWAVLLVAVAGCARFGMVDDGTTVSYGKGNNGALHNGMKLPVQGDGYWVPARWRSRGALYGTDELVTAIVRMGRRLQREDPAAPPFGVADLSPAGGGPSRFHRSHQSGRDVDLLFYLRDVDGKTVRSSDMVRLDADGATAKGLQFDVERNWRMVRALLEETSVEVQYIFVYEPLKYMLLDYAEAIGEPFGLLEHARAVLHQPSDSAPHNDHFHVRVHCAPSDRVLGCEDRGLIRWKKKGYKYELIAASARLARPFVGARVAGPLSAIGGEPSQILRAWSLPLPTQFRRPPRTSAAR